MISPIIALDFYKGELVNLLHGNIDANNKIGISIEEVFTRMYKLNINKVHIIDIEGAMTGNHVIYKYVKKLIKENPNIKFQVGGGIRDINLIEKYCKLNADIILSTAFIENKVIIDPSLKKNIAIALDFKSNVVKIGGWTKNSTSMINDVINKTKKEGLKKVILTNILNDGSTKHRENDSLEIIKKYPDIDFIISGGIDDTNINIYKNNGVKDVIVGRWFYNDYVSFKEFIISNKNNKYNNDR